MNDNDDQAMNDNDDLKVLPKYRLHGICYIFKVFDERWNIVFIVATGIIIIIIDHLPSLMCYKFTIKHINFTNISADKQIR